MLNNSGVSWRVAPLGGPYQSVDGENGLGAERRGACWYWRNIPMQGSARLADPKPAIPFGAEKTKKLEQLLEKK